MNNFQNFITKLKLHSVQLNDEIQNFNTTWGDSANELYVMLFGFIAARVVKEFNTYSLQSKIELFQIIELGATSNDEKTSYAVCMGFIEGFIFKTEIDHPEILDEALELFGNKSKEFAIACINFSK